METDVIRWFQLVADGVTVTEIAEIERITQSGISRALARLESDVGTPLLTRSGRVLRMTHAGSVFKRHADVLLHELDDGLAAVAELLDPESGTVTLAFHLSLGTWLVPDLVGSFRRRHPRVHFDLKPLRDEPLSSGSQRTQVDLEITTLRPRDSTLRWRSLLVEPLRLAVSSRHRLAGATQVELSEVAAEPFVMLRATSALRHLGEDLCRAAGFQPEIAFEGDDLPTVRGFVAAGLGVAIVPALREGSPDVATGPLHHIQITDPHAEREIGLTWSAAHRLLPTAEVFRQHIIDRASKRKIPGVIEGG
jgi:LysR family transcriptional activator of glutamate synthase operon